MAEEDQAEVVVEAEAAVGRQGLLLPPDTRNLSSAKFRKLILPQNPEPCTRNSD